MLVWGGVAPTSARPADIEPLQDGGAYDPQSDSWRLIGASPLGSRTLHSAVWTGSEMLVWGGMDRTQAPLTDGAAYDPSLDTWRSIAAAPKAVASRGSQRAVLGGTSMFVAEIGNRTRLLRYDIGGDAWERLPRPPVRLDGLVSLAWAGDTLVLLSFPESGQRTTAVAAAYDVEDREWTPLARPPLSASAAAEAIWTGHEVITLARPIRSVTPLASGAALDVATDSWTALQASPACTTNNAAWVDGAVLSATGAYALDAQRCDELPPAPEHPQRAGLGRESYSTVWTGEELIVWSGATEVTGLRMPADGAAYRYGEP